jgi:hypothetical protein
VLELCWRFFLKPRDTKGGVRTHRQLATLTLQYCASRSLHALISQNVESDYWKKTEPNRKKRVQIVVNLVLGAARHWFEYKLPKHCRQLPSCKHTSVSATAWLRETIATSGLCWKIHSLSRVYRFYWTMTCRRLR